MLKERFIKARFHYIYSIDYCKLEEIQPLVAHRPANKILKKEFFKVPPTDSLIKITFPTPVPIHIIQITETDITNLEGFNIDCTNCEQLFITRNKSLASLRGFPSSLPALEVLSLSRNSFSDLDFLPKKLPNLQELRISSNILDSFEGIPSKLPQLTKLLLRKTNIQSFAGLPKKLPNLKILDFDEACLKNFMGLPQHLPNLTDLRGTENQMSSFKGLPVSLPIIRFINLRGNNLHNLRYFSRSLPKLETLKLENNELESLEGLSAELPSLNQIRLEGNPIRTLSYIPRSILPVVAKNIYRFSPQNPQFDPEYPLFPCLEPTVLDLIDQCIKTEVDHGLHPDYMSDVYCWFDKDAIDTLYDYFRITPLELAQQYIRASLSKVEVQRLSHEASPRERQLLENANFPADDPILAAISTRLQVNTPLGFKIMK
jgi:Leucine Rich Repeat (LRR) protein